MTKIADFLGASYILAVLVVLGGGAIYGAWQMISIAAPMVIGSYQHYRSVHFPDSEAPQPPSEKEKIETYHYVCTVYGNSSYVYRKIFMRDSAWCEEPRFSLSAG